MKQKFAKKKTLKKTTLRNKADLVFSKWVRSKGICELKGKDSIHCGGAIQCMHIITRGHTALRFDEQNALAGCQGHHVWYSFHPEAWLRFITYNYPERWAYLGKHLNDTVKKTEELYRSVITRYTEEEV